MYVSSISLIRPYLPYPYPPASSLIPPPLFVQPCEESECEISTTCVGLPCPTCFNTVGCDYNVVSGSCDTEGSTYYFIFACRDMHMKHTLVIVSNHQCSLFILTSVHCHNQCLIITNHRHCTFHKCMNFEQTLFPLRPALLAWRPAFKVYQ
jgi:hypothetical protein